MREILFKAKRKNWKELPKEKWWVEGNLIKNLDGRCFIAKPVEDSKLGYCLECGVVYDTDYQFEVIPDAVCQYTGLTDKNGKKIWENDITKLVLPDGEVRYFKVSFKKVIRKVICHPDFDDDVAKVELNSICFEWNGYELFPCINENGVSDVSKKEVLGNIFDNPELLESMK